MELAFYQKYSYAAVKRKSGVEGTYPAMGARFIKIQFQSFYCQAVNEKRIFYGGSPY